MPLVTINAIYYPNSLESGRLKLSSNGRGGLIIGWAQVKIFRHSLDLITFNGDVERFLSDFMDSEVALGNTEYSGSDTHLNDRLFQQAIERTRTLFQEHNDPEKRRRKQELREERRSFYDAVPNRWGGTLTSY